MAHKSDITNWKSSVSPKGESIVKWTGSYAKEIFETDAKACGRVVWYVE